MSGRPVEMKVVEFYGGPHDGQRRETNDDTIALTMPWEGCIYLYKQRANWGQTPVMFDYARKVGTQIFGADDCATWPTYSGIMWTCARGD